MYDPDERGAVKTSHKPKVPSTAQNSIQEKRRCAISRALKRTRDAEAVSFLGSPLTEFTSIPPTRRASFRNKMARNASFGLQSRGAGRKDAKIAMLEKIFPTSNEADTPSRIYRSSTGTLYNRPCESPTTSLEMSQKQSHKLVPVFNHNHRVDCVQQQRQYQVLQAVRATQTICAINFLKHIEIVPGPCTQPVNAWIKGPAANSSNPGYESDKWSRSSSKNSATRYGSVRATTYCITTVTQPEKIK